MSDEEIIRITTEMRDKYALSSKERTALAWVHAKLLKRGDVCPSGSQ